MINIEQITSRLAKMPDQSLQQYAMMHKDDPYIIALAMSESKRRKDMRASAQAGPAQAQPKVVDQALMDMAPQAAPQSPDEAGIASLPAGDMNFADGGIVERYADEGLVAPRYETPYDRMNRQNREAAAVAQAEREAQAAEIGVTPYGEQMSRMGSALSRIPGEAFKTLVSAPGYGLSRDAVPSKKPTAAPAVPSPQTQPTPSQIEAAAAPAPKPKAETGLGGTKEAAAARGPVGPSADEAKRLSGQFLDTKTLRSDLDKFYKDEEASVVAARKRREDGKPTGEAYSKAEEALKKEEAGAGKEKDEAQGVALFKAGLAMMAGGSPNAFANIGKGAMVGLEDYSGAMKDMKKAAKERQKAFGEIEQARRAESRDDWKTAQAFEDKADARMAKAREFAVKGIMDFTGKSAELSAGLYKTQVEQEGALKRTNIQAAATRDRGAAGLESKELTAAESAFARDPQAKALSKSLEMLALNPESPKYKQNLAALQAIRADKYKQFGITLEGAPGAASPGGTSTTGWGKAQVITP